MYYAIGLFVILFVLALPLPINIKSFFSLRRMSVGFSFSVMQLGPAFAYSFVKKRDENKEVKEVAHKANKILQKLGGFPVKEVMERMRIDNLRLNLELGFQNNAMYSVIICNIISNLFDAFVKFFPGEIQNIEKLIVPRFNSDICFFDFTFNIRLSSLEIINLTFVLIIKFIGSKIKNRGEK